MADFEERVAEDEALEEREDRLVWYVGVKQRGKCLALGKWWM